MMNGTGIARFLMLGALCLTAVGCSTRRVAPDLADIGWNGVSVDGRVVYSDAPNLLELLRSDPQVRRLFEGMLVAPGTGLVILDGVPITGTLRLADIRLVDVERIRLLSGTQAMGRYGSRGAAGAIIIDTRLRRQPDSSFADRSTLRILSGGTSSHSR